MTSLITETQIRAARELLRWDQQKLADVADLSLMTVKRLELGQSVAADTADHIVATLEKAGVLFIADTTINGIAVSGAVALRAWAQPEPRQSRKKYEYDENKKAGRPKGSKNKPKV